MSPDPRSAGTRTPFVVLTCEHGGCEVPPECWRYFRGAEAVLESHRGFDPGALGVACRMAARLSAPILFSTVTRLLVDLNRSIGQPDLFSEFVRDLPADHQEQIIERYYEPHRRGVRRVIESAVRAGCAVVHLGVHSCVDELQGQARDLDISLLFDETRERESQLCKMLEKQLRSIDGELRCPFNVPYRGSDDGFTTTLREQFGAHEYLGIEIELRQGMVKHADQQRAAGDLLADSLSRVLPELSSLTD